MIFNKDNNGAEELRSLTGNYYANNNFENMPGLILLATSELKKIIGASVYGLAETAYMSKEENPDNIGLVPYVQLPIAINAALNMYRQNDVSHEDSGRKVKIDANNEKIPWQWQLDKDDEIQLDKYYSAVDALIDYLDEVNLTEWKNSDYKKATKTLLINSATKFDRYYPIGGSGRMYILLLPFLRETELKLKRQFGTDWARYLTADESESGSGSSGIGLGDPENNDAEVLEYLLPAIPLLTMSVAVKRLPLGVIPKGIVRNYSTSSDSRDTSNAASASEIKEMSDWMEDQAEELIDMAKRIRNKTTDIQLLPTNSPLNKFMRV